MRPARPASRPYRRRMGRWLTPPKVAVLIVVFSALTYGAQIPIYLDDFENCAPGTNPTLPAVGEPWQISEPDPGGIGVLMDPLTANNLTMGFFHYRNIAVAPFSAENRQRLALAGNATIRFDYTGFTSYGYSHYFDVGAYDPVSGDPAFLVRFAPQASPFLPGMHDVHYLDPMAGLVDTGLDVTVNAVQPISILADFTAGTYQLDVAGVSTTALPMFVCPNEIAGVEFANYGVAMGSGAIDNLSITVTEPDGDAGPGTQVPEIATLLLLIVGAGTLACARVLRRKAE
ncbi:MAG: hypothetical protein JXB62_02470 [Pirellulales bacterium]|nr:hypothetical protein [Pirellulales bacterium]